MSDHRLERNKVGGDRHYKTPDGENYPSVTSVTGIYEPKKKGLANWEAKVGEEAAERIKNEAGQMGTIVHHRILNQYKLGSLPKPEVDFQYFYDDIEMHVGTCLKMWDDLDYDVERAPYVEERVASHKHGYAGTFDMLTNGTVVDLKTSKKIRPSHKMQISAYYHVLHELDDYDSPNSADIIKLNPRPETNPGLEAEVIHLEHRELSQHFETFLDLLSKYKE